MKNRFRLLSVAEEKAAKDEAATVDAGLDCCCTAGLVARFEELSLPLLECWLDSGMPKALALVVVLGNELVVAVAGVIIVDGVEVRAGSTPLVENTLVVGAGVGLYT